MKDSKRSYVAMANLSINRETGVIERRTPEASAIMQAKAMDRRREETDRILAAVGVRR